MAASYRKTWWIFLSDFFLCESKYMELELRSVDVQGAHAVGGRAQGEGARPPPSCTGCGPPDAISFASIFISSKNILRGVSGHPQNFYFCTKIKPWQFCWKQRQSGLVPFKSCKLESKTRAKVFGKVDTMEDVSTPPSLNLCLSSSNSVDKLKVTKKSFYKLCLLLLL